MLLRYCCRLEEFWYLTRIWVVLWANENTELALVSSLGTASLSLWGGGARLPTPGNVVVLLVVVFFLVVVVVRPGDWIRRFAAAVGCTGIGLFAIHGSEYGMESTTYYCSFFDNVTFSKINRNQHTRSCAKTTIH